MKFHCPQCDQTVEVTYKHRRKYCSKSCAGRAQAHPEARQRKLMCKRWYAMIQRCHNPATEGWGKYGARGIRVCPQWHDFDAFLADVGFPPPGMTLDRIDNDGNYEPGNVRWATPYEQRMNQRPRRYMNPPQHGAKSGYHFHRRNREPLCGDCRAFYQEHRDEMRGVRK